MNTTYRQYRFTSQNFVLPGESGDADAYIDPNELQELRKLAGLPVLEDMGDNGAGLVSGLGIETPQAQETGISSPLGSNESISAADRKQLEREYHAQTGTDLWFIINFAKPELTKMSVRDQVERYLKQHPEYRPRYSPKLDK